VKLLVVMEGNRLPVGSAVVEMRAETPDTLRRTTEDAIAAGTRHFGVIGSDADAATIASVASRAGVRVAIAPPSNGDLARAFALAGSSVVDRLVAAREYPIDIGHVEGAWGRTTFLNGVAAGAAVHGARATRWIVGHRGPVEVSGRRTVSDPRASAVLVCNGQFWDGVAVAPKATPMDGVFDIQVLSTGRSAVPGLLTAMARGLHLGRPGVTRTRTAEARISIPPRWSVVVDGVLRGRGSFTVALTDTPLDLLI